LILIRYLFALFVAALALPLAAAAVLRNPLPIPYGADGPSYILKADFNGDQHDDALTVAMGKSLSVLISTGTGPFSAPVASPMPYQTVTPAIGDVNGDGRNDVIVSDFTTRTIVAMLGNGDGTFAQGPSSTTADSPGSLALGDFNGDHLLDVAVGTSNSHDSNTITVYFGDGGGHFSAGPTTNVDAVTRELTPCDFNADGRLDLVVTTAYSTSVFLGNGDGAFLSKASAISGMVAVADLNHDGRLDLAIAAGTTHEWLVEVDFGNGDGTLTKSAQYPVGYESNSIVAADIDTDGNPDLLLAGSLGSAVAVLRGKQDGTFSPPQFFLSGPGAAQILVSDFDRDGKLDFLTLDNNEYDVQALSFVRGNGDGTFDSYRVFHTGSVVPVTWPGLRSGGATVADMNNDGKPDVVLVQQHPNVLPFDLAVMLNDGSGKPGTPILTDTGKPEWNGIPAFAVADVNHDGNLDVVLLSGYPPGPGVETFLGHGDGTFSNPISFQVTLYGQPILADFDGDAIPDLFIQVNYGNTLQHGNGDGTFGPPITSGAEATDVFVGDVNGDGKLDYVVSLGYASAAYVNDGTGHFTRLPISSDYLVVTGLADFDGDGKLDLLTGGTQVRRGNGDGTFGAPVSVQITPTPFGRPVTADFDGDGKLDVVFGTTILLGNGDGTFRSRVRLRSSDGAWFNAADMDGNGSPDLVFLAPESDDIDVVLTRTTADPSAPSSITLVSNASPAQYGQSITFTASVSGTPIPLTGAVSFAIGGQIVAITSVGFDGNATFTTKLPAGSYDITATYAGDENYLPSTTSLAESVSRLGATLTLSCSFNPQAFGRSIAVLVSFNPIFPPGPVTLRDGDTQLNVEYIDHQFVVSGLSIGSHVLTADYAGDANFEPVSGSYVQVITKPVASFTLQTQTSPLVATAPITIHAFFGFPSITGTIAFYENNALLGSGALANGSTDFQYQYSWGFHTVEARYSGDATWAVTSKAIQFNVIAGPWGTPLAIRATGIAGGLLMSWSQITGATAYTFWRKQSFSGPWQTFATYSGGVSSASVVMPSNVTWLVAVTATDSQGNVSPMSPPDLATSVSFDDSTVTVGATKIKATHIIQLRNAIGCVRTFAGLQPFSYTNSQVSGSPILASDFEEMRIALSQARGAIGFPSIAYTNVPLVPQSTPTRAAHLVELRAGVD
jgi:hypothetical protein